MSYYERNWDINDCSWGYIGGGKVKEEGRG